MKKIMMFLLLGFFWCLNCLSFESTLFSSYDSQPFNDSFLIAAASKKKVKIKNSVQSKKKRKLAEEDSSSSTTENNGAFTQGLKLGGGFLFGIDDMGFIFGAEHTLPLSQIPNLMISFGASYWMYEYKYTIFSGFSTVNAKWDVGCFDIEGGADYLFPLNEKGTLVAGGRLAFISCSGKSSYNGFSSSYSDTEFAIIPLIGYEHQLNNQSAVGAQFKIPLYKDYDGKHLIGYYKMNLTLF